jgi:LAO/AO transport system kinase
MEMADIISITKADGNNVEKARKAQLEYKNALHLYPPKESQWMPKVFTCSAQENSGLSEIWENINEYLKTIQDNGYLEQKRSDQAKFWMYETIDEALKFSFYNSSEIKIALQIIEKDVITEKISSYTGAKKALEIFRNQMK